MKNSEKYKIKKLVNAFKCLRCGHEWIPRVELKQLEGELKDKPRICPKCKSAYWDLEPKNKKNKENKK
jgi:transcription elongation factor Elf1